MEVRYGLLCHGRLRILPLYNYHCVSYFFLLFLAGHCSSTHASANDTRGKLPKSMSTDCLMNQRCGNVRVRYPFAVSGSNCPSFQQHPADTNFTLNCTQDVLYLGDRPVLSILPDSLILNQRDFKSSFIINGHCNRTAVRDGDAFQSIQFDDGGPYISAADNHFGSFGCSFGFFYTQQSEDADGFDACGCLPGCNTTLGALDVPHWGKSSYFDCGDNLNCCTSNFPAHARNTMYSIQIRSEDPSPCRSYAVPFHPHYTSFQHNIYGFRVLWALPDQHVLKQLLLFKSSTTSNILSIADLPGNISTACTPGSSSQAIIVNEVPGYRCSCLPGYHGDGYAQGMGCVDIDECSNMSIISTNLCIAGQAECRNANGSYSCHCKSRWHTGDGMSNGTGCILSPTLVKACVVTGGLMGFMVLLFGIVGINILVNRRRKQQYFEKNGGLELQAYIAAGTGRQTTRFFTAEELREATQNFSEQFKLGAGGFGTVYRGRLKDGRVVAIKKANRPGDADKSQFLNELAILTQINHRHIVKLHGCCLETANPLLVYEFVSNGDLAENLASAKAMGWEKRLQVATQVADALAYLHAAASPPILHRDVKTANILLDDNLDAKVADFGMSRLIPEGEKCVSTAVQGTLGYLDPEYFQTLKLTDKSDVYSLGVLLVELITGLKPVDNHLREVEFANLALLFLKRMWEERLHELVDARLYIMSKGAVHTSIQEVAKLAQRCLGLRGEERPSMSELALTLHQVTISAFERPADHDLVAHEQESEEQGPQLV